MRQFLSGSGTLFRDPAVVEHADHVKGTLEKMEHLTEEEFSKMDLTPYLTELLEDKEWI